MCIYYILYLIEGLRYVEKYRGCVFFLFKSIDSQKLVEVDDTKDQLKHLKSYILTCHAYHCHQRLKTLQQPIEHWDAWLMTIVSSLLDKQTGYSW